MSTLGGLTRRDGRNLLVVAAVVTLLMAGLSDGSMAVRLTVGLIAGVISAVAFVVSTLVINRFKPASW